MANKIAFIDPVYGNYYIFNADYLTLSQTTSDPSGWNPDTILPSLTPASYKAVEGYQMAIVSDTTGNVTTTFTTYDLITTTDATAIPLGGFSGITSFAAVGTGCHIILSFDKRQTWHTFNVSTSTWEQVSIDNIYTNGMTIAQINAISTANIAKVFQHTQLDFAVALATGDEFGELKVVLPANSAPTISNIVLAPATTHNTNVNVSFDVTDYEGDNVTCEVFLNGAATAYYTNTFLDGTNTHTVLLEIKVADLNVGTSALLIKAADNKTAVVQTTVYVTKTNTAPTVVGLLVNNVYSATVGDADEDKIKYRLYLNDVLLEDWSDFIDQPLNMVYEIDRGKILYGVMNTLKIEYMDNISPTIYSLEEHFVGSYYGLLFCDTDKSFYTDSLKKILKRLDFKAIIKTKESDDKIVYIANKTNKEMKNVIINVGDTGDIDIKMSLTKTPFENTHTISFDKIAVNEEKMIYVRLSTSISTTYGTKRVNINAAGSK